RYRSRPIRTRPSWSSLLATDWRISDGLIGKAGATMTAGVSTLAVGESGLGEAAGASVDDGSGDAVASGAAAVVGDGCTVSSRCAGAHAVTAVASSTSAMTGRIRG